MQAPQQCSHLAMEIGDIWLGPECPHRATGKKVCHGIRIWEEAAAFIEGQEPRDRHVDTGQQAGCVGFLARHRLAKVVVDLENHCWRIAAIDTIDCRGSTLEGG
jgi:hypothetical protein